MQGQPCDSYQVTNLESVLISLQPLLLDLVADVARILMQLLIHIGLPRPLASRQLLHSH